MTLASIQDEITKYIPDGYWLVISWSQELSSLWLVDILTKSNRDTPNPLTGG